MPDVSERCPFCNSGDRREETWRGRPAYSFSCGTVFYENGEVALRYFACYTREKEREERAIREQLAAERVHTAGSYVEIGGQRNDQCQARGTRQSSERGKS